MPFTKNDIIRVSFNSVREIGPRDREGASSFLIEETDSLIYEGTSRINAIAALQKIPVGASVSVETPTLIRSCMNKPALWNDMVSY